MQVFDWFIKNNSVGRNGQSGVLHIRHKGNGQIGKNVYFEEVQVMQLHFQKW